MKRFLKLSIFIITIGLFASCDLQPDMAPVPTFEGKANMTIEELLELHEIGSTSSYDSIPAGTIITGIVTTSDQHGNCYKYINIEDGTGGIQIKLNNTALFNRYKVGQRVFVKCDGLIIGDYRKLPQIGYWANDEVQAIPSKLIYNHIFCDGIPENDFEPTITLNSIPRASDLPSSYLNRLVRLTGCSFVDGGNATFCEPNSSTSRSITLSDGTTIIMRTSNYADFINEMLPTGTGDIIGILTRYNSDLQIVIRDLDDVIGFKQPASMEELFHISYTNAFNEGWTQYSNNVPWQLMNHSSFCGFYINSSSNNTNSWLVSPEVDLSGSTEAVLSFRHRAPNGGDNNTMKLLYTTNFTGDVNTTTWSELPISSFSTSFEHARIDIPSSIQSSKFRIAFQYNGGNSSWYIGDLSLAATFISITANK